MGRDQDRLFSLQAGNGDLLEGVEGKRVSLGGGAVVCGIGEGSVEGFIKGRGVGSGDGHLVNASAGG